VRKCSKGVYDKDRDPIPVVVYPDGCVDHCHGCGNTCPTGAIKSGFCTKVERLVQKNSDDVPSD